MSSSLENTLYLLNRVMPTSFPASSATAPPSKLFNTGPADPVDYFLDNSAESAVIKNEPSHRTDDMHADEALRSFQEWSQASLKQTGFPAAAVSTVNYNPPNDSHFAEFTSPYSSPHSNLEDYQSPFDTPLFDFEDETNIPPTPQYNSNTCEPLVDEGYGTGNSKAFYIDFGFSPHQLNPQGEFSFNDSIFEPASSMLPSSSLLPPLEEIKNMSTNMVGHRSADAPYSGSILPASPASSSSSSSSSSNGSPKRKRVCGDDDFEPQTRQFACQTPGCGRVFARLFNLHTHEKTHDPHRDKPYVCSAHGCAKAFARKHDLYRHETSVHDGLREYKCEKCSKLFSRKDALRRHYAVKGCDGV